MNSRKSSSLFLILVLVSSVFALGNLRNVSALTPVADLTGQWSGFAQLSITEGYCEFIGKVNAQLTQTGNNIKGQYTFVQTGAKSSNPDVYHCDMGTFGQDIHGTIDGSRITLYSEDSTFTGWYASSGINLSIASDGVTGQVQLSPVNFTPPPFTQKSDDAAKKKAADDAAKKKAADDAAKKKAADDAAKKKAADDAAKKDAGGEKKRDAVANEKKTEQKKTESENQQNKIDTIPWTQVSARVNESKSSNWGKTQAVGLKVIDLALSVTGKQTKPNAYALFSHYFGSDGKPYEFKEIPNDWQDWIVKQVKDKKDGSYPLSPYNTGPDDLRESLGGFNVEVTKNSDGTRTYKISDIYNFEFTPEELKQKKQHGRVVDWSPTTIRNMNKFLANFGEYDYPDGKMKEKFEIKKLKKGNTLILPQKYLVDNGLPFQVKGEFTK